MGVALLEELQVSVIECLLVLEALPGEVDLNLSELGARLRAAYRSAREAYDAASLLNQGATLANARGAGMSAPQVVLARHGAAARAGAAPVLPTVSGTEPLWRALKEAQEPEPDHCLGSQPVCSAIVQSSGLPCGFGVLSVGLGLFGTHCYHHVSAAEKDQYRVYEAARGRAEETRQGLREMQRAAGVGICADWLQRREDDSRWFHEAVSLIALAGP